MVSLSNHEAAEPLPFLPSPFDKLRVREELKAAQPREGGQSTEPTNSVLNSPPWYSLTTIGTESWRFWPNEVEPT